MTRARAGRRDLPPHRLLMVTLDPQRGLALLRGTPAERAAWLLSPNESGPKWSSAGKGWTVTHGVGLDAIGYAQAMGFYCRVTTAGSDVAQAPDLELAQDDAGDVDALPDAADPLCSGACQQLGAPELLEAGRSGCSLCGIGPATHETETQE